MQRLRKSFITVLLSTLLFTSACVDLPSQPHGVLLPQSLFATNDDQSAWARFSEVVALIEEKYYQKLTGKRVIELLLKGGLTSIDPHSFLMDETEYQTFEKGQANSYGGIGIDIKLSDSSQPKGVLVIAHQSDDTPSARVGIKAGDIIVEIEGRKIENMQLLEIVKLLRGPEKTSVNLKVYRDGASALIPFTIMREIIQRQLVRSEMKPGGFGYLKITSFLGLQIPHKFKVAVRALQSKYGGQLNGYIIDLRDNPGGFLPVADQSVDLFLDRSRYPNDEAATTISLEARGQKEPTYFVGGRDSMFGSAPVIILVNGISASASEIFAGVLQIHGRAIVVGAERTFGKGTVQSPFLLQTGGALLLTTKQYFIGPVGCEKAVQGVGIIPNILLKPDPKQPPVTKHEEDLSGSIGASPVTNENCKYHFTVPAEHFAVAYRMIAAMGLEPIDMPPQSSQ